MVTPNVIVSPEKFKLVFGVNEDCTIELTNVGYDAIIYRLQTMAPDHYVVKHAKGVVRGNSVMKIIITLNQRSIQQYNKDMTDTKIIKDDFLLEYALLGETDVIEPRYANVSQLIKDKKRENPGSVLRKILRSHIFLDTSAATPDPIKSAAAEGNRDVKATASHPQNTPASSSSPIRRKTDTKIEENAALVQKETQKKPSIVETALSTKTRPIVGSRFNTVLILSALIVAVVVWMLME